MTTKETQAPKVLPADVYDTLEFASLAFGGIGADWLVEPTAFPIVPPTKAKAPFCLVGYAGFVVGADDYWNNPISDALATAFGGHINDVAIANNKAVHKINASKGGAFHDRVSWEEYAPEMGFVRGDS